MKDKEKRTRQVKIKNEGPKNCYDLKNLHTKVLLSYLDRARKFGGSYDPTENGGPCISIEDIKKELETRPHISNKKEAREIRKQKAK